MLISCIPSFKDDNIILLVKIVYRQTPPWDFFLIPTYTLLCILLTYLTLNILHSEQEMYIYILCLSMYL